MYCKPQEGRNHICVIHLLIPNTKYCVLNIINAQYIYI